MNIIQEVIQIIAGLCVLAFSVYMIIKWVIPFNIIIQEIDKDIEETNKYIDKNKHTDL